MLVFATAPTIRWVYNKGDMTSTGGEILKTAREKRGLTQGQLAYITGIAQAEISRWEHGHCAILSDRLLEILAKMQFELELRDGRDDGGGHPDKSV